MADLVRLRDSVAASGLKKQAIAQKMGVTPRTLRNKMSGACDFTADEIVQMSRLLSLSPQDMHDIFLS